MNSKALFSICIHWLMLLVTACALSACADVPTLVRHSFEFDARRDSPEVEILDYRYGDSKQPGARNPEYLHNEGKSLQATGVYGSMLVGDSLYVKWRIRSSGEVYQDTVDLRDRLPADIKDHYLYFIVKGSHLYVYLISPEKLDPNPCMAKGNPRELARATNKAEDIIFAMYCYRKITAIYPDQPKN